MAAKLRGHGDAVSCTAAAGAGLLVSGGKDAKLKLWDVEGVACSATARLPGPVAAVECMQGDTLVARTLSPPWMLKRLAAGVIAVASLLPKSQQGHLQGPADEHPLCTAPSLIPTVNGNTVRSFSTHGQLSAAQGGPTTVSRSEHPINITYMLDSSALWFDGPEVALNWLFPYPI